MRTFTMALVGCLMASAPAMAADLAQPESVRQVAFNQYDYMYTVADQVDASPSDSATPEQETISTDCSPAPACGGCRTCDSCCLGEAWTLPQPCIAQNLGIEISGWVSAGIYANAHGAARNGPLGTNDLGDGFNVNQMWLSFDRATDTGGCGVQWGGHVDFVFGADGQDTQAFGGTGWDNDWDTSSSYGSAMPQAYVELAIDDLTIKGGHFYTIIGWEVFQATGNFFHSHAYTMYYAEPFTHTGFLASYALCDDITVHGGWTTGWDGDWGNANGASHFLGGTSLTLSDNSSLTWACSTGTQGNAGGTVGGQLYMNSFVYELGVTERLTYILQHDLGAVSGLNATPSQWYGINQYLQYQLNDCWAAGTRIEWFRDDDDARGLGGAGNYYEATWGLNYRPHANVMIRPELRYDWVADSTALPFNDGTKSDQFSGGFDVIFSF